MRKAICATGGRRRTPRRFDQRAQCLVKEYSSFTAVDDVKVNGELTLGENTADNGGLRLAYMALMDTLAGKTPRKRDGFTAEQRFFLGWGQIWCENISPESARVRAQVDPHSPGEGSRERRGFEHAGIPEGVRVPHGPADGALSGVPGLVKKAAVSLVFVDHTRSLTAAPQSAEARP